MSSPSARPLRLAAPHPGPVAARSDAERLLAVSTDLLLVLDDEGRHVSPNPAWEAVLGWAHEDLVGRSPLELVHPDDRERTRRALDALGGGEPFENRWLSRDGSYRRVAWSSFADAGGGYAVGRDVTDRREAERLGRRHDALLTALRDGVSVLDGDGRIVEVCDRLCEMLGFDRGELLGCLPPYPFCATEDPNALAGALPGPVAGEHASFDAVLARKDGSRFPVSARLAAILDGDGERVGFVSVFSDLSERVESERKLRSARDSLAAINSSMGEGVCTVDADGRVRFLNQAAESMLGWSSEELRGRRKHEAIHHHRGDGTPYPASDCPLVRARRTGELLRVDDDEFIRKDGSRVPVAYTSAPVEMEDGAAGSVIVFHDISERKREQAGIDRDVEALAWLPRIRDALDQERFILHAQPIIDIATGAIVQHELLIRMLDEEGGLVPPGVFLPPAERYGLIREIDRWVIRQAAGIAARGHDVELNISAESLGDPNLYETLEREVRMAGADPALIVIELTETALLRNDDAACEFIVRSEQLGCRVALDDFGTGYGGFSYIKRLPVDSLKIDVDFVRDLPRNPASQHVVRAIVNLARDFGHHTVAEGVEDDETLEMLRELGVDFAQGYGIARPAPLDQTVLAGKADRGPTR
jgi:PAS domain S-box-containing protein